MVDCVVVAFARGLPDLFTNRSYPTGARRCGYFGSGSDARRCPAEGRGAKAKNKLKNE